MLRSAWEGRATAPPTPAPPTLHRPLSVLRWIPPVASLPVVAVVLDAILRVCKVPVYPEPQLSQFRASIGGAAMVGIAVTGTALALVVFVALSAAQARTRRMFLTSASVHAAFLMYLVGTVAGAAGCLHCAARAHLLCGLAHAPAFQSCAPH